MKIDRLSSCEYFYGQDDASLWWNLPYNEALETKKGLCNTVIHKLCLEHHLKRDSERINRCMKIIKDIDKMLKDKPDG